MIFMHESGSSSVSFGLEGLMVGQSPEREGDEVRSPRLAAAEMEVKLGCTDPQEVGGDSVVSRAFVDVQGGQEDFPGGPALKTLRFHGRGHGFDPWSGN